MTTATILQKRPTMYEQKVIWMHAKCGIKVREYFCNCLFRRSSERIVHKWRHRNWWFWVLPFFQVMTTVLFERVRTQKWWCGALWAIEWGFCKGDSLSIFPIGPTFMVHLFNGDVIYEQLLRQSQAVNVHSFAIKGGKPLLKQSGLPSTKLWPRLRFTMLVRTLCAVLCTWPQLLPPVYKEESGEIIACKHYDEPLPRACSLFFMPWLYMVVKFTMQGLLYASWILFHLPSEWKISVLQPAAGISTCFRLCRWSSFRTLSEEIQWWNTKSGHYSKSTRDI